MSEHPVPVVEICVTHPAGLDPDARLARAGIERSRIDDADAVGGRDRYQTETWTCPGRFLAAGE
jgi:hypothetical protein